MKYFRANPVRHMLAAILVTFASMGAVVAGVQADNTARAGTGTVTASLCDNPLRESEIDSLFHRLAKKQLALEFGEKQLLVYDEVHSLISPDLYKVAAYAKFRKPGHKKLSTMRVIGWLSVCQGTLIIRGNTWLANGTLAVTRYAREDLPGRGLLLGKPDAETRVIAFVDSRCPHCHRLIGYARELLKDGKLQIEIRQVAYLEPLPEALRDTRLSETSLVAKSTGKVSDLEYLDMLTGLSNEEELDNKSAGYNVAKSIVEANTNTAKSILHQTTVPALLVLDKDNRYRMTSFWEMNRILQPDL